MKKIFLLCTVLTGADAIAGPDSGEHVYRETCFACHATKFDKAPQFGDRKAWAPLIAEGQEILTAHAWVGVRNMPPRGGRNDLKLEDFARATAYMVRGAGGTWTDPDHEMLERMRAEVRRREQALRKK